MRKYEKIEVDTVIAQHTQGTGTNSKWWSSEDGIKVDEGQNNFQTVC